jgi:hypothetical protein
MMWVYLEQLIVEKNNEKQQKIVSSGENNWEKSVCKLSGADVIKNCLSTECVIP